MNNLDEILKLKELLDSGLITESDFKKKKEELLKKQNKDVSIDKIEIPSDEKIDCTEKFSQPYITENSNKNYFIIAGVVLVLIVGIIFFNRNSETQTQVKPVDNKITIVKLPPKVDSNISTTSNEGTIIKPRDTIDYSGQNLGTVEVQNVSKTYVTIGNQNWLSKNLDVSTFSNGELIREAKNADDWKIFINSKQPAWSYLFYDSKNKRLGKIYNWYAVFDSRGLAPIGWHIPDIDEWHELINFLGGKEKAVNKILGEKWTDYLGGNFKKTFNESNFNAIFGGEIDYNNNDKKHEPSFVLNQSFWWSSETPSEIQFRGYPEVSRFSKIVKIIESSDNYFLYDKENAGEGYGGYVRCIKN